LRVGLEASEVARLLSETAAHAALEAVKEAAKEAEGVD
jgi:predicted DsbA family dithiol-disulfide isomerase